MKETVKERQISVKYDEAEHVIDRFLSHAKADDDSCWLIRVRWAGFDAEGDTWEPAEDVPEAMLRTYERRKNLAPCTLLVGKSQSARPVLVRQPELY
jgi:hypothetical protein